jgi:hypothetical protein
MTDPLRQRLFLGNPAHEDTPVLGQFEAQVSTATRILFLDDDPLRSAEFLQKNPYTIWVETVADCISALEEPWDEVHLDHDLGGARYVDHDRNDCGMAVIRWLCDAPRDHLKSSIFVIHTHNAGAAIAMVFQLESMGYIVEERRFGTQPAPAQTRASPVWMSRLRDVVAWIVAGRKA